MINMARENNFRLLNIAVGFSDQENLDEQLAIKTKHYKEDPDITLYGTTFSLDGWDNENWANEVIRQLKTDFDNRKIRISIFNTFAIELI